MVRSVAACPSTSCRLLATIAVRGGGLARDVTSVTVVAPTEPVPCGHTDTDGQGPDQPAATAAGGVRTAGDRDEQVLMMARRLPDALRLSGSREPATVWAYLDTEGAVLRVCLTAEAAEDVVARVVEVALVPVDEVWT
jgi:hypothetical protein